MNWSDRGYLLAPVHEPTVGDQIREARRVADFLNLPLPDVLGDRFMEQYRAAVRAHRAELLEDLARYRRPAVLSTASALRLTVLARAELAVCDRVLGGVPG